MRARTDFFRDELEAEGETFSARRGEPTRRGYRIRTTRPGVPDRAAGRIADRGDQYRRIGLMLEREGARGVEASIDVVMETEPGFPPLNRNHAVTLSTEAGTTTAGDDTVADCAFG